MQIQSKSNSAFWTAWAVVASFGTYFCMYAFRKPFTVALPEGVWVHGIEMKSFLITAQVAGYMLSKFIGVKVVAELKPAMRALAILLLIGMAESALLLFAITPAPYSAVWLFVNGLPLGMVFGLVISFIEGRQRTEFLAAALCASFIVADGFTKSLGAELVQLNVPRNWVPAAAGGVAGPFFVVFVIMLAFIPPASAADVAARSARPPLDHEQRRELLARFAPGLSVIIGIYLILTILRSIRSDFAPEIWRLLGQTVVPATYTWSELIVGTVALVACGALVVVKDNHRAFHLSLLTAMLGFGFVLSAIAMHHLGISSAFMTMVLIGMGLYLPYLAIHCSVFERLLAMSRQRGSVAYLITFADAIGYLGYVATLVLRQFLHRGNVLSNHFLMICLMSSLFSAVGLLYAVFYFNYKCPRPGATQQLPVEALSVSV